jgi:Tfp pilus assembly protein PilX
MDIMGPNTSTAQRVSIFGSLPAGDGCSAAAATKGYCGTLAVDAYKTIFAETSETARQWAKFGEFTDRADEFPVSTTGALPSALPRYIIQKSSLSFRNRAETVGKPFDAFIITAVGYGLQPSTQVVLQALISKPVPTN